MIFTLLKNCVLFVYQFRFFKEREFLSKKRQKLFQLLDGLTLSKDMSDRIFNPGHYLSLSLVGQNFDQERDQNWSHLF